MGRAPPKKLVTLVFTFIPNKKTPIFLPPTKGKNLVHQIDLLQCQLWRLCNMTNSSKTNVTKSWLLQSHNIAEYLTKWRARWESYLRYSVAYEDIFWLKCWEKWWRNHSDTAVDSSLNKAPIRAQSRVNPEHLVHHGPPQAHPKVIWEVKP